jgi:hypothetical protein
VLETDLEIEALDWEKICYKDGVVRAWEAIVR